VRCNSSSPTSKDCIPHTNILFPGRYQYFFHHLEHAVRTGSPVSLVVNRNRWRVSGRLIQEVGGPKPLEINLRKLGGGCTPPLSEAVLGPTACAPNPAAISAFLICRDIDLPSVKIACSVRCNYSITDPLRPQNIMKTTYSQSCLKP
jgi:hypothetical protein